MNFKIICCRRRGKFNILSRLIMMAEKLPFSHFAMSIDDSEVYESVHPRSRTIQFEQWSNDYEIVRVFEFKIDSNEDALRLKSILIKYIGTEYGIDQLFTIGLSVISKPIERLFRRVIFNGKQRLICCEYVALALTEFYNVDFGESEDAISLRDTYRECLRLTDLK